MRWTTIALLAAVLCTAAAAQSVNLTYAPPAGDPVAYKATIEGSLDVPQMAGLQVKYEAQYKWTVTAVEAGKITRQVTVDSASLDVSGQELPCTFVGFPAEGIYGPDGRLSEATKPFPAPTMNNADTIVALQLELHDLWLPAKEVAVGDTWEIDAEDPPSLMDMGGIDRSEKVHVKGTLESFDGTVATIVAVTSIEGEGMGAKATGEIKCTIKVDTGTWVVISGEATLNLTQEGPGGKVVLRDWKIKVERATA